MLVVVLLGYSALSRLLLSVFFVQRGISAIDQTVVFF